MRMSQIEQALTIAAEGSISRAAQKLYLSQPNLSKSLKQLESELGAALFERSGRGVVLTRFGREFISFAQPAYRHFRMLDEFCTYMDAPPPLTFSVASQYLRFANMVFTEFCQAHKKETYQFSFTEGSFQEIVDLVRTQEAEIGLLILSPMQRRIMLAMFQRSNLEYRKLAEEDVAIIVRSGHPLCMGGRSSVSVSELLDYPFAIYRDIHYSLTPEWNLLGVDDIRQKVTVKDRATLYELLGNTDAFTIGVHNQTAYANTEYYSDKQALRLSDSRMTLEIGYITNRSRPLSPIAAAYRDEIERITRLS